MSKLFSMKWFRSNKEKEQPKQLEKSEERPFSKIILVNDEITIIMNNGDVVTKGGASTDDYIRFQGCKSTEDVYDIIKGVGKSLQCVDKTGNSHICKKSIKDGIMALRINPEFTVDGDVIYLNEVKRTIPQLLVERFAEVCNDYYDVRNNELGHKLFEDETYLSLKKFWLKCCLNPNARSAEDLYEFLSKHNVKIDKHGNFYAYRRVVYVGEGASKEFITFINNAYNKIKAVWKKKPSDYYIEKIGTEYKLSHTSTLRSGVFEGNLEDLYLNLPNMLGNRYTDAHTHSMDYRVGQVARIPRNECDDNNSVNCSRGSVAPL